MMQEKIKIIKHGTAEAMQKYDEEHDTRKNYYCKRCGCEWKCEYFDNIFGSSNEYNGDPAILCPECNCNDIEDGIEEFVEDVVSCGELDCAYCFSGKCLINYHRHPQEKLCKEWVRC